VVACLEMFNHSESVSKSTFSLFIRPKSPKMILSPKGHDYFKKEKFSEHFWLFLTEKLKFFYF